MENSNWRSAQAEPSSMEAPSADWRSHLQPDARQRIVNKIMDTLKRHLPVVGAEGMGELKKIALRFEEKIYSAAVNQSDYLRRISMKMLSMETKTQQNTSMNPQPGINQNSTDTALQGGSSQVNSHGQPLSQIPMVSQPPGRQQLLAQNMQNNAPSMMGSSNLSATSSLTGLSQSNLTNYHASNMQNMPGMSHGAVNNSLSQGTTTDIYGNAQRQMQNRQQQQQSILSQQQQQQSQNALLYQNQLPPQIMNQKMHNNAHIQSIQQQQQQQQPQSLFQANQLQSSQQSVMQMPSGQSSIQQSQATAIQSAPQSSLQQNQLNSIQQSVTSSLPQHMQAISRQSQQPLSSVHQQNSLQQQSAATHQQSNLQTQQQQQQQQQLLGQQANMSNIQQNQMLSQQNNIVDIKPQQQQQQRLPSQQNNLVSMQQSQQSLNQQSMSLHQQQQPQSQQQQLLGSLQNASNMQQHQRSMQLLQQSKNMSQTQQQLQQPSMALMQPQGQQSHLLSSQQKLMPQFQSQSGQLQQQLAMQQQPNSIQRDMQQRLQLSGGLLQSQTAMEPQKPFMQSQRGIPEVSSSTSIDSTAQTGQNGADWQEEAYQKIQSMKEAHFAELQDFHLKITLKVQQPDLTPQAKQSENYEKLKSFKQMLDRLVAFLQISKSNITPNLKEKLPTYEKQLINMLASNRRQKVMSSQQGHQQHFQLPVGNSQSTPQHQQSQVMQAQQQDNNGNQAQQMNMSSAVPSSMQHGAMTLSSLAAPAAQQNITNSVQAASDLDPVQVSAFGSLQQGSMGSVQQNGLSPLQNSVNTAHQNNLNNMSQNSMNLLQANNPALQSSNVLQQQHLKQQEQLMQRQQLQQRQIQQQQLLQQQQQRQQLLQTQQLPQQQKQQQPSQMPVHQMSQHHPMNEINELKARQGPGIKPGPQSYPGGQRHNYYHQQLKPGSSFPISSPQNLQAPSPQISHNSSPQIDQHALLPILTKNGTPVQSTGSPFVVPSPSTPIAPSPIPGDSEKLVSAAPSHQIGGHATLQQPAQVQAISVATPGISASPLLAEFTSQEGNLPNSNTMLRTSASERPLERLIKAIQSVSPKALSSAVSDITSVVSMIDRIAGSAPGNGSRAAVGEDLVAMTKCRLQARNFMSQDGGAAVKKMKRHTSAMPLNNVSSPGSVNENFMRFNSLDTETTATSRFKRQKFEGNHALQEEIREINRRLIDTVVSICDEDSDSVAAASEGSEGVIVKCSYTAVALSPSLKAHFASMHLSPIAALRLLVPANYPNSSPLLLDKLQPEPSKECEDLHIKAKSRFSLSLRGLSQPMSLGEMAGKWDACARKVIVEYAEQMDGGSFSSTYGTWENCVGA